jgi:arylsulfatase A-like enzyme
MMLTVGQSLMTIPWRVKNTTLESSIQTTCILGGGGWSARMRRAGLVQTIDLPPTLLEAFGIALPPDIRGAPWRR